MSNFVWHNKDISLNNIFLQIYCKSYLQLHILIYMFVQWFFFNKDINKTFSLHSTPKQPLHINVKANMPVNKSIEFFSRPFDNSSKKTHLEPLPKVGFSSRLCIGEWSHSPPFGEPRCAALLFFVLAKSGQKVEGSLLWLFILLSLQWGNVA